MGVHTLIISIKKKKNSYTGFKEVFFWGGVAGRNGFNNLYILPTCNI